MQCRKIIPLLYLYRDGELSKREVEKISQHLASCSSCAGEMKALRALEASIGELRRQEPILPDPRHVTDAVMRSVVAGKNKRSPVWGFSLDSVRFALGAAAALVLAILMIQTVSDIRKISDLEARLGSHPVSPEMDGLRALRSLEGAVGKEGFAGISTIRTASAAESILSLLRRGLTQDFSRKKTFADYLSDKYPGFFAVTVEDGINEHERKILESEGKAILGEIQKIIQTTGESHGR